MVYYSHFVIITERNPWGKHKLKPMAETAGTIPDIKLQRGYKSAGTAYPYRQIYIPFILIPRALLCVMATDVTHAVNSVQATLRHTGASA